MGAVTLLVGTTVWGTTTATPGSAGTPANGDQPYILAVSKRPSVGIPAAPSGWTAILDVTVNAAGAETGNQGPMRIQFFERNTVVSGGAITWPAVANYTGAGQVIGVTSLLARPASGESISAVTTSGQDLDGGTSWSVTGGGTLSFASGDALVALSTIADNGVTSSGGTLTASGVTFGTTTEHQDSSTGNGDDQGCYVHSASVASGTATSAPTLAQTISTSNATQNRGGTGFLRLRSASTGGPVDLAGKATAAATVSGALDRRRPTATAVDAFDDGTLIPEWAAYGTGTPTESGGCAVLVPPLASTWHGIEWADTSLSFTESQVSVQVVDPGGLGDGEWSLGALAVYDTTDYAGFTRFYLERDPDGLYIGFTIWADGSTQVASLHGLLTDQSVRWLRIRETGGQIYPEVSVDGITWAQAFATASWATPAALQRQTMAVDLEVLRDAGSVAGDPVRFDNLNLAPSIVELAGTASAAARASGVLGRGRPLAGQVRAASSSSGVLGRGRALAGAAAAASSAAGALTVARGLAGAVAGAGASRAALARARALAGASSSASAAAGALTVARGLSGASSAAAGLGGALNRVGLIEGTAPAASSATGTAGVTRPLSGVAGASSAAVGGLGRERVVEGSANGATDGSGSVAILRGIGGSITGSSGADGLVEVARSLAGSAAAASGATGELTTTTALGLAGEVAAASGAEAELVVARGAAGTAAAASSAAGALGRARPLSGAGAASSSASGDLTVAESTGLAGAGAAASGAAGALTVARSLAGTSSAASSSTGTVSRSLQLSGQVAAAAAAGGLIAVARGLSGSSSAASSASGTTTIPSVLEGAAAAASGAAGALEVVRGLAGSSSAAGAVAGGSLAVLRGLAAQVVDASSSAAARLSAARSLLGVVAASSSGRGRLSVRSVEYPLSAGELVELGEQLGAGALVDLVSRLSAGELEVASSGLVAGALVSS